MRVTIPFSEDGKSAAAALKTSRPGILAKYRNDEE